MTEKPTYEELEQRIKDLENASKEFDKRYRYLYRNAPVMVHSIDPEGVLLDVSEFWLEKMGYERKDVIGKKSIAFLTETSRQKAIDVYLPEFFKRGHIKDVPYQMVKKNGDIMEVLLSAISEQNENNDIERTFAVCVDISDQMRTERKLRKSEKDLKLAQKIGKIGNWSWEVGPDRAKWSDQVYEIFKAPRKEPSYAFAKTFVHPEDLELWEGTVQQAVENMEPFAIDYRAIRPDGQIIWVHNETEAIFNDDRNFIGYRGTIQDITDRKIEEEKLGEQEGKYRLLFENAQDAIFIADPDTGTLLDVNKSAEELTGYNKNEIVGKHQTFIHPSEQSNYYSQEFMKSVRDKYSTFKEMVVRTKNGKDVPVEISSGGTALGKNRSFHVGFFRDISARKKIVESLIKSESIFRGLYDYMTSGSAIYEVRNDGSKGSDYIVKNFNKKSLEIEGKTIEQVVGKSLFDLRPNIDEYGLIPVMKKVWETGEPAYFPIKIYQDEIFSNYYENYIFRIPTGDVVTIYNDVTDQKSRETALKESEERFALAMEFANDGLFDWNLETNDIYYSPVWKRMLGYENDELPNDFSVWEKLTDPEDVKRSWEMQNELINKKRDKFEIEFKMLQKDGHWVDILSRANAIFDENGIARRIIGTHVDISDRKRAEKAIQKSEQKYRHLIQTASDAIYLISENGRFSDVNPAACSMLNRSREEILNLDISGIDPNFSVEAFFEFWKETPLSEPRVFETTHLHKDGFLVPVEVSGQKFKVGEDVFFFGIARNIADRKRAEDALRRSEALHREAQRVAKIGHWELDSPYGTPIWSEQVFHIFGLDPKTSEPSFAAHASIIHGDDWKDLENAINDLNNNGTPFDLRFQNVGCKPACNNDPPLARIGIQN